MFIYKFTHIPSGKCYIGQTIKEVNKRTSGGKTWKVIDGKRVWLNKGAAV